MNFLKHKVSFVIFFFLGSFFTHSPLKFLDFDQGIIKKLLTCKARTFSERASVVSNFQIKTHEKEQQYQAMQDYHQR
jgi:hypothetical protein